jgi:hypothetical protein
MPLERPLSCTYLLALFGGLFPPPPLSLLLISLFLFLLPYSYKYVYELTVRGSGAEERWNCWLIARFAVVVSAAVLQAQARRDRHHHPHHRFVLSLYSLTRDTLTHSFLRSPLHASLQPTANASLPPTSPSSHSFLHRSSSSLFCLRLVCRRFQCRDRRVQEHFVHRLGCWRTGQDQAFVEALLVPLPPLSLLASRLQETSGISS